MNTSEKKGLIYTMLPRFVTEKISDRFLPIIDRAVEINGVEFKFEIVPACVGIENVGNTNFYPGATEELMETALRHLAVEDNPNFLKSQRILAFSFAELTAKLEKLEGTEDGSPDSVKRSLTILCGVSYELSDGERRLGFRPIDWLREKENDGETYYMVQFSSLFLNGNEMFDFCFADEIFNKSGYRNL